MRHKSALHECCWYIELYIDSTFNFHHNLNKYFMLLENCLGLENKDP